MKSMFDLTEQNIGVHFFFPCQFHRFLCRGPPIFFYLGMLEPRVQDILIIYVLTQQKLNLKVTVKVSNRNVQLRIGFRCIFDTFYLTFSDRTVLGL